MSLLSNLVFLGFIALTVSSAIVVVFHSRVIYSAFALLFTLFGVAGLYVLLDADFLAASQVMIYVGGILILIIFGVFMTTKISGMEIPEITHQRFLALIPIGLMAFAMSWVIFSTDWHIQTFAAKPTTEAIGELLLTRYLVPFEMASVLLLAALIGAMRLARLFRGSDQQ